MKRILFKIVLGTLLISFLGSCTIRERMVVRKDGSGTYHMLYDMSEMLDQLPSGGEDQLEKKMDTMIHFKEAIETYKDSIQNLSEAERTAIMALEDFHMGMKMDPDTKEMKMNIGTSFSSMDDLKQISEKLRLAQKMAQQGDSLAGSVQENPMFDQLMGNSDVSYSYTGKVFERTTRVPKDSAGLNTEDLGMLGDMLANSKYIIELEFPKKVKKVHAKGGNVTKKGKKVVYERSLLDFFQDATSMDLRVELKK